MHLSVSHLDEGVQSLSIHLQELCFNVQHVNFCPGNHCSDKDTICGAQPLKTHTQKLPSYRFIRLEYLPVSFARIKYLPSSICTGVPQRRPACSECISLQGNNKDSLFQNTFQQRLHEGALYTRDAPMARKTSSRDPDISLLMLSSMSLPEIFRYSSNTKGRRYNCIHLHSSRLVKR